MQPTISDALQIALLVVGGIVAWGQWTLRTFFRNEIGTAKTEIMAKVSEEYVRKENIELMRQLIEEKIKAAILPIGKRK